MCLRGAGGSALLPVSTIYTALPRREIQEVRGTRYELRISNNAALRAGVVMSTGKHIVLDVGHANGTGACVYFRDGKPVSAGSESPSVYAEATSLRNCEKLEEHAVCAELAVLLKRLLVLRGFTVSVIDYPEASNAMDLNRTVAACNALQPDFIVSLHCDCSANKAAQGAHVCYLSRKGLTMARCIAARLCELLPGRAESVVPRANLAILRKTHAPAVLVECGFLSNEADAAMLRDNLPGVASAIAQGVCDYFTA